MAEFRRVHRLCGGSATSSPGAGCYVLDFQTLQESKSNGKVKEVNNVTFLISSDVNFTSMLRTNDLGLPCKNLYLEQITNHGDRNCIRRWIRKLPPS